MKDMIFQLLVLILLNDEYPEFLADRGGYYVNINGNILKKYREDTLSLKDLADLAHVSRETIYKYENDIVRANPETAMLLEDILNMKITVDIDLFDVKSDKTDFNKINSDNSINNEKTKDLTNLDFGVLETKSTPFDALAIEKGINDYSAEENSLIASLDINRPQKTLHKMAISLKDFL